MTFGSNVAPRRRIKEKHPDWRCECDSLEVRDMTIDEHGHLVRSGPSPMVATNMNWQPGYLTRCERCGMERP